MASHAGTPERVLIGREAELAAVREVLNRAADGQSETLLVFGEAGVGKTSLVQQAVPGAAASTLLLSGACLPLQSISVPLLPLRAPPAQLFLRASAPGRRTAWSPSTRPLRC